MLIRHLTYLGVFSLATLGGVPVAASPADGAADASAGADLPVVALDARSLLAGERQVLPASWRFRPLNERGVADGYELADPHFPAWQVPSGWTGAGVFELALDVPPELVGRPLALVGRFTGAAKISLDGRELGRWGEIAPYRGITNPTPMPLVAVAPGAQNADDRVSQSRRGAVSPRWLGRGLCAGGRRRRAGGR